MPNRVTLPGCQCHIGASEPMLAPTLMVSNSVSSVSLLSVSASKAAR